MRARITSRECDRGRQALRLLRVARRLAMRQGSVPLEALEDIMEDEGIVRKTMLRDLRTLESDPEWDVSSLEQAGRKHWRMGDEGRRLFRVEEPPPGKYQCRRCWAWKPHDADNFVRDARVAGGVGVTCRDCSRRMNREWAARPGNHARYLALKRRWNRRHRKRLAAEKRENRAAKRLVKEREADGTIRTSTSKETK